jgi:hypothetical protein
LLTARARAPAMRPPRTLISYIAETVWLRLALTIHKAVLQPASRQVWECNYASQNSSDLRGGASFRKRKRGLCAGYWRWTRWWTRSFPRYRRRRHWLRAVAGYRNGRNGTQCNADPGYRNWQPAQHHADAWDRNHPGRHTHRRASERRPSGRRASEPKASERAGPQPRGHQGGNRGRYSLPAMSRQRQISERAAGVPRLAPQLIVAALLQEQGRPEAALAAR